jgi:hypothetical protein
VSVAFTSLSVSPTDSIPLDNDEEFEVTVANTAAYDLPVENQASFAFAQNDDAGPLAQEPAADELTEADLNQPSVPSPRMDNMDFLTDEPAADEMSATNQTPIPFPRMEVAAGPQIDNEVPAEGNFPGNSPASTPGPAEPHADDDLAFIPPDSDFLTDAMMDELTLAIGNVDNADQDENIPFVLTNIIEDHPSSTHEPTESHADDRSTTVPDDTTPVMAPPEPMTELHAAPQEQPRMPVSPPRSSFSHSNPTPTESIPSFLKAASEEDIKPYTFLDRELSPLSSISSISSISGPRTPSPSPRTAIVRLAPKKPAVKLAQRRATVSHNPTGSTGDKKRKGKRKHLGPPTKRPRKGAAAKGVSLPADIKWPKKTSGDDAFRKTVKLYVVIHATSNLIAFHSQFVQCDRYVS